MVIKSFVYFKYEVVRVLTQVTDAETANRDLVDFLLENPVSEKEIQNKSQAVAVLENLWEKYKEKYRIGQ